MTASQIHSREIDSIGIESTRTKGDRILRLFKAKYKFNLNLDLVSTRTGVTQSFKPNSVEKSSSDQILKKQKKLKTLKTLKKH